MLTDTPTTAISPRALWTGRILSALFVCLLLFDTLGKLMRLAPVVEGTARLGYPESLVLGIGLVELRVFMGATVAFPAVRRRRPPTTSSLPSPCPRGT